MIDPIHTRLMRAIKRLGKSEAECAAAVGFTTRTLDNWEHGIGLRTVEKLEKAGIIHIAGECACQHQPADAAPIDA